jgi:hypothetical protein
MGNTNNLWGAALKHHINFGLKNGNMEVFEKM